MTIKVICSWCGCVLGFKQGTDKACPDLNNPISHSICAQCMKKALAVIRSSPDKPNSHQR